MTYAGNDIAYQQVATLPELRKAAPVSAQIAALSVLGLEAMQDTRHSPSWHRKAAAKLAEAQAAFAASADHVASFARQQPAGGLLIAILPGLEALVGAAR